MSLTNLQWYVNCISIYKSREDTERASQMYTAAVNYCNKCGIEIAYLNQLLE